METATINSRRTRYNHQCTATKPIISTIYHPEEKANRFTHAAVIPFLVLVYIVNGSHDPKKVDWLNIILSAAFFAAGITLNPDFLFVGTMFFAITLANIASVWVVQNLGESVWSPALGEILSQLHVSVRYTAGR